MNAKSILTWAGVLIAATVLAAASGLAAARDSNTSPLEVKAASTLTIFYAVGDASINDTLPGSNFGDNTFLLVGQQQYGSIDRSLLQFTVNLPPGTQIDQAYLKLYLTSASGADANTIVMRRIVEPWSENTVTWTSRPGYSVHNYDTTPVGTATGAWYYWYATELVRDWFSGSYANYGVMMISQDESTYNARKFDSSEASHKPRLEVQYTLPTSTPTRTFTRTRTPTRTPTRSVTRTPTRTRTPTWTPTRTKTPTVTRTATATFTRRPTRTPGPSPTWEPVECRLFMPILTK